MDKDNADRLIVQLMLVANRVRAGKYIGGTGSFLGFRVMEDLDKAFRAVGWKLSKHDDLSREEGLT